MSGHHVPYWGGQAKTDAAGVGIPAWQPSELPERENGEDNDGNRDRGRGRLQGRAPGWTQRHHPSRCRQLRAHCTADAEEGPLCRAGKASAGREDGIAPPGTAQSRSALPAVKGAKRAGLKRRSLYSGNSMVSWWDFYGSGSEDCCDLPG